MNFNLHIIQYYCMYITIIKRFSGKTKTIKIQDLL
jgi:hypothetical protein